LEPAALSDAVLRALQALQTRGLVPAGTLPKVVTIERPKNREHGDWATNAAMQLGSGLGINPRELAQLLASELELLPEITEASVAGPGFINLRIDTASAAGLVRDIMAADQSYGHGNAFAGVKLNLEFVSANPTGPIHIGGTRWAAVGDSLARILQAQGAEVVREYYFNDHGVQIDRFAKSLLAAARGLPTPEDGYGGAYITEIAQRVLAETAEDLLALDDDAAQEKFREAGVALMFAEIRESLHDFGVDFDVYFHENSLYESGAVERAITRLRELGHIFEADGATWLRSSSFGDDRDRVVIKADGNAAYIAGDLAYYLDKRSRGFDRCIYMLGADHHGYVPRMMAMCAAFGDTPGEHLEIMIGQMVSLMREGEPLRMSKRAGTVVTMEDLVEAVGVDAARYALARSSINQTLDIDLEQLSRRTNDNPVFYVQYAHARTRQIVKNAELAGVATEVFDPSFLSHESESVLIAKLAEFPRVLASAAEFREPHRVARYLEDVAGSFHRWYDACRVIPLAGEPVTDLHHSRLALNLAVSVVLRNGLGLLGVAAPERM
jgi:arginyl-tRNA synthetase